MKTVSKQEYLDAYDKAPDAIKENMNELEMGRIIRNIGEQYSLSEEEISLFAREIGLVQLGFTAQNAFADSIHERFELGKREASDIADQVDKIFFRPFESFLKSYEINGGEKAKPAAQEPSAPAQPSYIARLNKEKQDGKSGAKRPEVDAAALASDMISAHGIHIDQAGAIQNLIQQTIDGKIRSKEFTNQLKNEIGVSKETAQTIASEINEKVFEPIHRSFVQPSTPEETTPPEQKVRPGEEDKYREPIEQDDLEISTTPPPPKPAIDEQLNRDDVLREIEDTEPAEEPPAPAPENTGPVELVEESGKTPGGRGSGLIRDMFAEEKQNRARQAGKSIVREKLVGASGGAQQPTGNQQPQRPEDSGLREQTLGQTADENKGSKDALNKPEAQPQTQTLSDTEEVEGNNDAGPPEESFESKKSVANSDPYREQIG